MDKLEAENFNLKFQLNDIGEDFLCFKGHQ